MPTRIAVVMASSGVDDSGLEARRQYLQAIVAAETEIIMIPNPSAPDSVSSMVELDRAAVQVVSKIGEMNREGLDAAVIWCGDDPGLDAAREASTIPVVGPMSASLSIALHLGDRFAIVTSPGSQAIARRYVQSRGLAALLVDVTSITIPVLEIRNDLSRSRAEIIERVHAARASGANSVILGCMAMYGLAASVTRATGVPVIDPGEAAVLTAQSLVAMRSAATTV